MPGHHRPALQARRHSPLALVAAAVLVLIGTVVVGLRLNADRVQTSGTAFSTPGAPVKLGVLDGSCDAERVTALHDAGVRLAEFGIGWSDFELKPQQFDLAYISKIQDQFARCRNAGIDIVLTPGFHFAPTWVTQLPGGAYRDQNGDRGPDDVPNLVFSAAAREATKQYLTRFAAEFPLDDFAAIRVGTGENGELGYPGQGQGQGAPDNSFWAFDSAALSGRGLPEGISANPMPGWVPGERQWNGREIATTDVQRWFGWYSESVARSIVWEIDLLRSLGFHGTIHVPLAGRGALPEDLAAATDAALDGTADRDGSLEQGLYYPDQLAFIANATRGDVRARPDSIAVDVTGVGDSTAVLARGLDPPQDSCRESDASLPLREMPGVDQWSGFRWTAANARANGLQVVGENPGPPGDGTGGDELSDGLAGQLEHAPQYARECGLTVLFWAFEDNLFADDSGVTVGDLARRFAP